MNQFVLGIDISKDTFDVALFKAERYQHRVFANTPPGFKRLHRWLRSQGVEYVHAGLEATNRYWEDLAEHLYKQGHAVSVINPVRIKRYGESKLHRNKTDKADATLIAEFCWKEKPRLWEPLPLHVKQLRQMVRRLDNLQTMQQQERNRLQPGITSAWVVADLEDHLSDLQQRIKSLKAVIQQHITATPELKRNVDLLVSIPGIGLLTAARLLGEIGDITRFDNPGQLTAFAGLNPKGHLSGSSVYKKTRISKEGRPFLRRSLYMPALVARKHNPIVRSFCDRLAESKLHPMAVVVAAMGKLLHLTYGILKNQIPFDPNYAKSLPLTLDI